MGTNKNQFQPMKLLFFITIIVVIAVVIMVFINNQGKEKDEYTSFENAPPIEGQPVLGKVESPVQIVEFGDFKCPACKQWGETIYPQLVEDYVDTNQVNFSYINVLFHGDESKLGSVAAEAVHLLEPDAYWAFHKGLFAKQPESGQHDSVWLTTEVLEEVVAETTSIPLEDLLAEMKKSATIEAVNHDTSLVGEYEVQLTPTIMINDKMVTDPFDYDSIKRLIEEELEG
ncbi:DsbA family protein [Cytobacillus kochii]|uniref:DsbA family protein n=1 Tax=Cytobacillus kochii TaxID=859143 RepID=UPI0025A10F24|nr:thioredoxin domain-containing protein [Cytobacillus kochii]MDM5205796.1 thioredoxin domain-containing protein [Cytobacillus kochii]